MSLIFATQLTALATVVLAAFAIVTAWYSRRAFLRQSEEVRVVLEEGARQRAIAEREQAEQPDEARPTVAPLARAHLVCGEWLRRRNRDVHARRELLWADEMFTDMGMDAFSERASRELAAAGEEVRRRPAEQSHDLTSQETQIAKLAGSGLTNQEIGVQLYLSARTVEWHLRKVFGKLGITSRRQLQSAFSDRA